MVDLGGRAFLEFIMVLFATCLLEHQSWMALFLVKSSRRNPSNINRSTNVMRLLKHPLSVYFGLVVFVYAYGGIQSSFRRGAFFQRPTKDWLPATEMVACVVGPGGFDEDLRSDYSYWMQKSEDAAQVISLSFFFNGTSNTFFLLDTAWCKAGTLVRRSHPCQHLGRRTTIAANGYHCSEETQYLLGDLL